MRKSYNEDKKNLHQDIDLNKIELKKIETDCLNRVFDQLGRILNLNLLSYP